MIQFEVEGRPISLNELYTKHWSKRSTHKISWGWGIKSSLIKYKVPRQPIEVPVEISFVYYVKRPIDCDNCAGTCKVIIDFLREWGLLKNDSPQFVSKISIEVRTKQSREFVQVNIL